VVWAVECGREDVSEQEMERQACGIEKTSSESRYYGWNMRVVRLLVARSPDLCQYHPAFQCFRLSQHASGCKLFGTLHTFSSLTFNSESASSLERILEVERDFVSVYIQNHALRHSPRVLSFDLF